MSDPDISKAACDRRIALNEAVTIIRQARVEFNNLLRRWVPQLEAIETKVNIKFVSDSNNKNNNRYELDFNRIASGGDAYMDGAFIYISDFKNNESVVEMDTDIRLLQRKHIPWLPIYREEFSHFFTEKQNPFPTRNLITNEKIWSCRYLRFGETINLLELSDTIASIERILKTKVDASNLRIKPDLYIGDIVVRNKKTDCLEYFDLDEDKRENQFVSNVAPKTLSFHGNIGPIEIISDFQHDLNLITTSAQETQDYIPLGYYLHASITDRK